MNAGLSCCCRLLMGRDVGLEDLKDVHLDVYQNLKKLLAYEGDVSDLGLVFQVQAALLCFLRWLATYYLPNK